MKRIIWTDEIDLQDYVDVFKQLEQYGKKLSDNEKYDTAYEMNQMDYEDIMAEFNFRLPGEIIEIGSIGRWNGSFEGYKEHNTDILKNAFVPNVDGMSYNEWYVDKYNLYHKESHHDGTNLTFYRMFRPDLTYDQKCILENALYEGKCNPRMLRRYTVSIRPYIAKVFGWRD